MNANRLFVPLALAAILASGCLGYPAGSARPGDTVTIEYTARDPATGEAILLNRTALFPLGSGESGLGPDVERSLVGMQVNETRTVRSPAANRGFDGKQHLNATLGHGPGTTTVPTPTLRQAFGNITAGFSFSFNQYFNATVVSVGEAETTVRLVPNGQAQEVPDLGVRVRGIALGDQVALALEPMVGTTFRLLLAVDDLGLPAGSYKVEGRDGDRIAFAYTPAALDLVGRDIEVTARLVSVAPGAVPDAGGNYGARRGASGTGVASLTASAPGDDGHGH